MQSFMEFMERKNLFLEAEGVPAEIKLQKDGEFKPFVVDKNHHSNLREIIKAFEKSPEAEWGHSVLKKGVQEKPTVGKKHIYLVGGAVRDHLKGKTPKDFDLTTDATPDEIKVILKNGGFTQVKSQGGTHAPKEDDKLPDSGNKNKIFYSKGWDREGNEFVIGARINGQEFEIATFRKDSKGSDGRTPDKMEFASLEDDADRRDFTINAMYVPLTNADGDNNKLVDPHGGVHHLKKGEVRFVGNPKDRLGEDQLRALRFIRFHSRFDKKDVPPDVKKAIEEIKELRAVSPERIRQEFVSGLEHPDVDVKHYIKLYRDFGLLDRVFPDKKIIFQLENSKDFSDKKDKRLAIAWLLRNNDPNIVAQMLHDAKYDNGEISDIHYLIDFANWTKMHGQHPELFFDSFHKNKDKFHKSNLVSNHIKQWADMNNLNPNVINHFLGHELSTKGMVRDDYGNRIVNPDIVKHLGKTPQGNEFGKAIKDIETKKFREKFNKERNEKI